jgi:hypothetical protein
MPPGLLKGDRAASREVTTPRAAAFTQRATTLRQRQLKGKELPQNVKNAIDFKSLTTFS